METKPEFVLLHLRMASSSVVIVIFTLVESCSPIGLVIDIFGGVVSSIMDPWKVATFPAGSINAT